MDSTYVSVELILECTHERSSPCYVCYGLLVSVLVAECTLQLLLVINCQIVFDQMVSLLSFLFTCVALFPRTCPSSV